MKPVTAPLSSPDAIIRCPSCKGAAEFHCVTFAEIKRLDEAYFKRSKNFDYSIGQHSHGSFFRGATYYHGLSESLENISDLPPGYDISLWYPSRYRILPPEFRSRGSVRCTECFIQKKHDLNWPSDAYFQIEHKNKVLWAYDRPTALKLLEFLESDTRQKAVTRYVGGKKWNQFVTEDWFLRRIPTHFKTAKARPDVVKKLRNILGISQSDEMA